MGKFWTGTLILLITAFALLYAFGGQFLGQGSINFTDLETECRWDSQSSTITLDGRRMVFNGNFPAQSTEADLNYRYRQTGNSVRLNIIVDDVPQNESRTFVDECLASVVYKSETSKLQPGDYYVTLSHDGTRVDERIIEVK